MTPGLQSAELERFRETHAVLVARLHAESGAERWGVTDEDFTEALCRSALNRFGGKSPDPENLAHYVASLHLQDLALACALRKGSADAWEEFLKTYRPVLYAAARAIVGSAGEARARELADSLYADLYGMNRAAAGQSNPQDRRPLLVYFHGRSKLSTWLRAVLAQRHVNDFRMNRHTDSVDDVAARLPDGMRTVDASDPDRARLLPRLRRAVTSALAAVAAQDRLLLSLYYVQDMTLAQIGRLQRVHEATISRQLDRVRRELRRNVEHSLSAGHAAENGNTAQLGLSPAEVQLCFSYALEDWSFDLGGLLSAEVAKAQEKL